LAGDFGRNSEAAILLESFLEKYKKQITVAQDALDYFCGSGSRVLSRSKTLAVINLGKLQKLAKNNRAGTPVLNSMNLHELVTILSDWTNSTPTTFITKHADNLVAACGGRVSTTPQKSDSNWQIELAAYAGVWQLQNPNKTFEALSTAIYSFSV